MKTSWKKVPELSSRKFSQKKKSPTLLQLGFFLKFRMLLYTCYTWEGWLCRHNQILVEKIEEFQGGLMSLYPLS